MAITVTVLDTAGIQPFIFASNVLRENVGASEIVHRATRLWAFEELKKELSARGIPNNHNIDTDKSHKDKVCDMYTGAFEVDSGPGKHGAEVLYAGGGNTIILFQGDVSPEGEDASRRLAQAFVYRLSARMLQEAPGLNLYAAHSQYTWEDTKALPTVVDDTIKELGRVKGRDLGSQPALGWPVTVACTSTGLPANGTHPDTEGKNGAASRANRQVKLKWESSEQADERLRAIFPDIGSGGEFDWTNNFETLANLPERNDSYIAVVHADGNGMGARIKRLTDEFADRPNKPREYINEMRMLSCNVQETAQNALKRTITALISHLADFDGPGPKQHPTVRTKDKVQKYLPLRPIVFGGDDVTLVCAGPWGLAIAQRYLQELEKERLSDNPDDKPYACAGVAIVKTHYPFAQAYSLSEELLKNSKSRAKALVEDKRASALDWYYTTTGLSGDLDQMRQREYRVQTGPLNMTPIMLHGELKGGAYTWRNWDNFLKLIEAFGIDGHWQNRRNKTLRLREALRGGPDRVAQFWAIYGEEGEQLPVINVGGGMSLDHGWVMPGGDCEGSARCGYFDAIEIAEQFFELSE
jgi:hypothetical protein